MKVLGYIYILETIPAGNLDSAWLTEYDAKQRQKELPTRSMMISLPVQVYDEEE